MNFEIPEEISSEVKIFKSIYLFDLIVALLSLGFASITSSVIYPALTIPYYIFVLASTLFFLAKSSSNPGMRNYKTIYLLITKDNNTYYKVDEDVNDLIMYK